LFPSLFPQPFDLASASFGKIRAARSPLIMNSIYRPRNQKALIEFEATPYCCTLTLILTLILTFDLPTPKPCHFCDIQRSFPTPIPCSKTLGSFFLVKCCGQTDKQTDSKTYPHRPTKSAWVIACLHYNGVPNVCRTTNYNVAMNSAVMKILSMLCLYVHVAYRMSVRNNSMMRLVSTVRRASSSDDSSSRRDVTVNVKYVINRRCQCPPVTTGAT